MRFFIRLTMVLLLSQHWQVAADAPRQMLLSRHMEKATGSQDPALSACGLAQAQALAAQWQQTPLPWLLHTPFQRTKQTAQAFLQADRQLISYDPRQVELLIANLNNKPGNVLVVGHSNTIPALVSKLTGQAVAPLGEQDYGRFYLLTEHKDGWQLHVQQLPTPPQCQSAHTTQ